MRAAGLAHSRIGIAVAAVKKNEATPAGLEHGGRPLHVAGCHQAAVTASRPASARKPQPACELAEAAAQTPSPRTTRVARRNRRYGIIEDTRRPNKTLATREICRAPSS